jgi:hypothetical protein
LDLDGKPDLLFLVGEIFIFPNRIRFVVGVLVHSKTCIQYFLWLMEYMVVFLELSLILEIMVNATCLANELAFFNFEVSDPITVSFCGLLVLDL